MQSWELGGWDGWKEEGKGEGVKDKELEKGIGERYTYIYTVLDMFVVLYSHSTALHQINECE